VSARRLAGIALGAVAGSAMFAAAAVGLMSAIYNPSFARGLHGWRTAVAKRGIQPGSPHISVLRTAPEPILKCLRSQRHHPYLHMDVPGGADGYIEQSIIVPVRPGRLSFRTWGDLEPVRATVSIVDGVAAHRLLSFTPPRLRVTPTSCSHLKPITKSLNVTRYAGQAVGLRIEATAQGLAGTIADFANFVLAAR
jgi:hypothetical protein